MKTPKKSFSSIAALGLTALALAGCASTSKPNPPSAKELGAQQWNATRASVLLTLAKDQYNHGNFDKCKQTIDQAERLDPRSDAISVLSAQLAIEQGDMDIAEHELSEARTNNPKNAQAFYLSGVVYQAGTNPSAPMKCTRKPPRSTPRNSPTSWPAPRCSCRSTAPPKP